jgi:hypothetical protein
MEATLLTVDQHRLPDLTIRIPALIRVLPSPRTANFAGATDTCGPPAGSNSVTLVRQLAPPGDDALNNNSRSIVDTRLPFAR